MNMMSDIDSAQETPAAEKPSKRLSAWQRVGIVAAPLALIGATVALVDRQAPAIAAPPPPTVTAATPLVREVDQWDEYVGRFEPSRSVEVRPRVSGAVTAVLFTDGAVVRKGQLLFTIDPRPFTAALAQARAGLASAQSDLALAKANLDRAHRLQADDAVSQSDVDQLTAKLRAGTAGVAAAEALVRARALDVEFTQVRAPITGRISDRRVDAGNLVAAGDADGTLLTTINALDPMYFSFDSSEALFLKAKRQRQAGGAPALVEVRLQDETGYRWKGRLDFTDNGLDQKSGTIRGRAVLDNPDMFLTPGMFGNMRMAAGGRARAMMVPDAAIQTDQARKIVLVVANDGSVVAKPVDLGPVVDGLRIVRSGLAPQDRVVIAGTQMAMPGGKVTVRAGRMAPSAAPPIPPVETPTTGEASFAGR